MDLRDDLDQIYQAKHLFDSLGLGLVVTGEHWRFLYVNPAFATMMNSLPDEMMGKSMDEFVPADELPRLGVARRLRLTGETTLYELRLIREDGDLHVRIAGAPRWQDGRVVGSISLIADISDLHRSKNELEKRVEEGTARLTRLNDELLQEIEARKQTEKRLRKSNARYLALVEDLPALVCRILPDGTFTYVNKGLCLLFGKREDELVGQKIISLTVDRKRGWPEVNLAKLEREMPESIAGENRLIDDSGQVRWIRWNLKAIFGEFGRDVEFQMVGLDITEGKRIAEALAESEARFRAIFEDNALGMMMTDLKGRTLLMNRALQKALGYTSREVSEIGFSEIVHLPKGPEEVRLLEELLDGRLEHIQLIKSFKRKDGTFIQGRMTLFLVSDDDGARFGIVMLDCNPTS